MADIMGDPDMDAVMSASQVPQTAIATGDPDMDAVLTAKSNSTPAPVENTWWNAAKGVGESALALGSGALNAAKGVGESALALGSGALKAVNVAVNDILPGEEGRAAMRERIENDPVLNYRGGPEAAPILNTLGMVTKPVSRAVDFAHGALADVTSPRAADVVGDLATLGLSYGSLSGPGTVGGGKLTPAQQSALEEGQRLGMRATPGTESGSVPLKQIEAKLESQPWTSGPAASIRDNNQTVLNRSWAKAIGENADHVDSTVLADADERLAHAFESVRDARPRKIDTDQFTGRLSQIEQEFEGLLPEGGIYNHPLVKRLTTLAESGQATGEQLGSLSSKLGKAAQKQMQSPMGDRDLGMALYRTKDYVDDLVQQGLTPKEAQAYSDARSQYRSLMQLTSRVGNVNPSTGNVNGVSMASTLQKSDRQGFLYGKNTSDHYAATRFAQAFRPIVGDSGTATRSWNLGDWAALPLSVPANIGSRMYYNGVPLKGVRAPLPGLYEESQTPPYLEAPK